MNKIVYSFFIITTSVLLFSSSLRAAEVITYQEFYDGLSPYGTWVDYPDYGHVWHPKEAGFRPYATNGYWEYTNDGWFWDSGYDWGWAPFHYGSWLYDDNLGWLWVPGYDWAPAWVTWGNVDGYYAWAPLEPGIDINSGFGNWRPHDYYWNIVDRDHIYDRDLSKRILSEDQTRKEAGRISVINNFQNNKNGHGYFAKGPDVKEVQKYTNQRINQLPVNEINKIPERKIAENSGNESRTIGQIQDKKTAIDNKISAERENKKSIEVYKPSVQKSEPAQYSKAAMNDIKPIRSTDANSKWPSGDLNRQNENFRNMPVRESSMSNMHNSDNNRRR